VHAELGQKPDLIIGNYSDGNLVASLLAHRMFVTQCNIAHALEKTKYQDADIKWWVQFWGGGGCSYMLGAPCSLASANLGAPCHCQHTVLVFTPEGLVALQDNLRHVEFRQCPIVCITHQVGNRQMQAHVAG
jgi:hypothetical protein